PDARRHVHLARRPARHRCGGARAGGCGARRADRTGRALLRPTGAKQPLPAARHLLDLAATYRAWHTRVGDSSGTKTGGRMTLEIGSAFKRWLICPEAGGPILWPDGGT